MASKNAKRAILGHANPSPQKKRAKKDQQYLNLTIQSSRLQTLQRTFDRLRNTSTPTSQPSDTPSASSTTPPPPDLPDAGSAHLDMDMDTDNDIPYSYDNTDNVLPPPSACSPPKQSKKSEEEDKARRWRETLKALVDPLLEYWDRTLGIYPEEVASAPENPCTTGTCTLEIATVQVLRFDCHRMRSFRHCKCKSLPEVLVAHGIFPTSPSQPRMGISLELLEFYRTLSQHASDAVTALASGLTMVYRRRGFRLLGTTGEALQDPIRRALGNCLQWYDTLLVEIDRYLTQKIDAVKHDLPALDSPISSLPSPLSKSPAFALIPGPAVSVPATSVPSTAVPSTASTSESTNTPPPASVPSNSTARDEGPPASAGHSPPTPPSEGACDPYLQ
ncbi:hypothetical protein PQX77_011373, partial [Marasmius sp. AFHP31]